MRPRDRNFLLFLGLLFLSVVAVFTLKEPHTRALSSSDVMGAEIVRLERVDANTWRYRLKIEPLAAASFVTEWRTLRIRSKAHELREGMQLLLYVPRDQPKDWEWLPPYQQNLTYLHERPKSIHNARERQVRVLQKRVLVTRPKNRLSVFCEYRIGLHAQGAPRRLSAWARVPCLPGDMHPMHSQKYVTIMQSTADPEVWARVAPKDKS